MTAITRRSIIALAVLAATPALAQQAAAPAADPVAALRAFYAKPPRASVNPFLTPRLRRLYTEQQARSRRSGDVLPGLDFDFACGCQDNDDDYATRNVYTLGGRTANEATVTVKLKLFKTEAETRELVFKLVLDKGRWLIDDVLDMGTNPWVLSRLLQMSD